VGTYVFLILLATACLHAGWNVKLGNLQLEPVSKAVLFTVSEAIIATPLLLLTGLPPFETWPYLAVSAIFSAGYLILLMYAYRGPVSQVYPIVRGSAVLITAIVSLILPVTALPTRMFGDTLSTLDWLGIACLTFGLLLLSWLPKGERNPVNVQTLIFSAAAAVCLSLNLIAAGLGARVSPNTAAYIGAIFVFDAFFTGTAALAWVGRSAFGNAAQRWKIGLACGLMAFLSFSVAVWAMSVTSIPKVVAVRETSVLLAVFFAAKFGERLRSDRVFAAALVCGGLILIRLH